MEDDITGVPGLEMEGIPLEEPSSLEATDQAATPNEASAAEVQAAEDEIVATPPGATQPEGAAPVPPAEEAAGQTEFTNEEMDLIELPQELTEDASALELPTEETFPATDLPPLDVAPALPNLPVGEPARQLTARYKAVRIKVDKDPAVVALKEAADKAKTFEDERAALREYYRLLFKKIRETDKSLIARANALENAYLERLSQTRVEPTIPLNPPPTPAPLNSPASAN